MREALSVNTILNNNLTGQELKRQTDQERDSFKKQIEQLNQELAGFKKQSNLAQQSLEVLPSHHRLHDTIPTSFSPKANSCKYLSYFLTNTSDPPISRDVCNCHSDVTGTKSANLIKQYLDNASNLTSALLPCPIMNEGVDFDAFAAEQLIAG